MDKPIKPNMDLPSSFGGIKENFAPSKISSGYERNVRDVLGGANLNYLVDTLGQRQTYYDAIVDFINGLPSGKFITTDNNNKLVYGDMQQYIKRGIGETIFSLLPLTSSDLHLLDGGVLENGVYSEFYTYIISLYNGGTCPNCFCSEEQWQASVTQYGACAKFVIDSVNQTIRLPRIVGMTEGTVDINSLTDLEEAGLPSFAHTHDFTPETNSQLSNHTHSGTTNNTDINHTHQYVKSAVAYASGSVYGAAEVTSEQATTGGMNQNAVHNHSFTTGSMGTISGATTNNSRVSSIYGNSSTVQPQTVKGFYYIVIANTQADTYTLQLDDVATDLNGKVSKSGDIMIGNLTIDKSTPLCILKNTDLDKTSTTAPSDTIASGFQVQDKNGNYISNLVTIHDTFNNFYQGLDISRTVNGSTNNAAFGIFLNTQNQDFAYATAGVKQSITNWAFPSSRYDDLALGATGTTYTAPADGYVWVGGTQTNISGFIFVKNVNNGIEVTSQPTNVSGFEVRGFIPVSKGQLYEVHYGDVSINWFRFIYANGEA